MTVACMTAEEEATWRGEGAYAIAARVKPCLDCPAWFAREMRGAGCCDGKLWGERPKPLRGPQPKYLTREDRLAARRASWRESKRRARNR